MTLQIIFLFLTKDISLRLFTRILNRTKSRYPDLVTSRGSTTVRTTGKKWLEAVRVATVRSETTKHRFSTLFIGLYEAEPREDVCDYKTGINADTNTNTEQPALSVAGKTPILK